MWHQSDKDAQDPQVVEKLASIKNITTSEDEIVDFQWRTLRKLTYWIPLGERRGIQYGISRFEFDIKVDFDHERYVPISLKPNEIEDSEQITRSLHRLVEVQSSSNSTRPFSTSSVPRKENLSIAGPTKEAASVLSCEKVLSRFFEVGWLLVRGTNASPIVQTRFLVVKALGPPDSEGLWILCDVPWTEDTQEDMPEPIYKNPYGFKGPVPDEYLAQIRADRTAYLEGFPVPISYARIKDNADRKEFDLIDPIECDFVISSKVWLV